MKIRRAKVAGDFKKPTVVMFAMSSSDLNGGGVARININIKHINCASDISLTSSG